MLPTDKEWESVYVKHVSQCFSMGMWSSASLRTDAFRLFLASNISSVLFV